MIPLSFTIQYREVAHNTLAGAWAGGTEYGVNFVLLIKIVCLVLCVTSFPFVIFVVVVTDLSKKY